MEEENLPCADLPPERGDHLAYPTLTDIVAAMNADSFEPKLKDNPAFKKLEKIANLERETGKPPANDELDRLIAELEPENYNSTGGNLQCMRAFKSLRYIAARQKRME
ncbi:MAG: hypothetical protein K0S09_2172 [Sphingobacteriaceae bacterium]|jgi:hypothetical protein|nr:hypothetical protein [Sphingobacteriaceae bacterium]